MWRICFNAKAGPIGLNKDIRRKVLKSVVWKFLVDYLFYRLFLCLGGGTAKHLDGVYMALYPKPRKTKLHELEAH